MSVTIPLWLPIAYTLFLLILIPVYWKHYGPANFLWFSDISLFAVGIVLWTESQLLISMVAVGVLALEIFWNVDYFGSLILRKPLFGLSFYMFDSSKSLFLRGLSLFHVALPAIVIWLLLEWGYDTKAIYLQTLLTWLVLPIVYLYTDPEENINWVFGPGSKPQHKVPRRLYFWMMMLFYPLIVFLPSHLILKWLFN
ncbi:membrane-associated protein [Pontibacter cellulosilyticus]|uniref:Membrane-associated protein n=1 Tax=Pontibacter cellulosilyticus TaxID=1720253 RepID=A0A923ND99_9BACT|nr:membrane-associated protein [Pontibacter cellulosilyticus]MBC5994820.1 membrane-associated protein [Pontibacter cellulosilyticus]